MRDLVKRDAARKRWYEKNRESEIAKSAVRKRVHKSAVRKLVKDLKQLSGCSLCGERDIRCLDFHHARGTKLFTIGAAARSGYALDRIKKEIEKCDILCANCHRKAH